MYFFFHCFIFPARVFPLTSKSSHKSINFFLIVFHVKKTFSILFLMFDSLGVFLLWVCSCLLQCHTQCCHRCLLRKKKEKKKPGEAVDPKQLSQSIARVNVTMSKWSAGENRAHRSRAVAQLQLTEGVIIHKKKKYSGWSSQSRHTSCRHLKNSLFGQVCPTLGTLWLAVWRWTLELIYF